MLRLLSKYLVQYRRVCIPHIGTFELVQQSPKLNVADKSLKPPVFQARYLNLEIIPQHQFDFLSPEAGKEELMSFGEGLKNKIRQSGFYWKGFGKLSFDFNEIKFEPEEIRVEALQPLAAEKVLRENVQHSMLVGDQEMTSQQVTEVLSKPEHKRPLFIIVGWVVFILALIAILILLYTKHFQPGAAGMQTRFGL